MDPSMEKSPRKKALLDEFITTKLHSDGVFLIRLISSNSGDTITASLLKVNSILLFNVYSIPILQIT